MTACSINDLSVRMAPQDPEYPDQWLITYHNVWNSPGQEITKAWTFVEDVMSHYLVQPGYQIETLSNNNQEMFTWEVVNAHLFKPVTESQETYSGVVVCGCKLVHRRPA